MTGAVPAPLITADELAAVLDGDHDPAIAGIVVCDVRWYLGDDTRGRREYDDGHLRGALFVDLATDLARPAAGRQGGRHPLPSTDQFAATLGRLGIGPTTYVVAYDSSGGAIAARLWWMLCSIGHRHVAVLDGGLPAWTATGRRLATEVPHPATASYPVPPTWTGTVDADQVAALVADGVTVIDARARDRYRGDTEPIDPRAGHVPGAVNLPFAGNLREDGTFRSAAELAERYGDVGTAPVAYCGSGVSACHDLLALAVAGIDGARLYPGSWSEWSADSTRPIATGTT
jgi:thiosulfate/3-mercaptopyruvate sulfurtransferase